jgi:hypothetical protein
MQWYFRGWRLKVPTLFAEFLSRPASWIVFGEIVTPCLMLCSDGHQGENRANSGLIEPTSKGDQNAIIKDDSLGGIRNDCDEWCRVRSQDGANPSPEENGKRIRATGVAGPGRRRRHLPQLTFGNVEGREPRPFRRNETVGQ